MQFHFTVDLRAVIIGFILLLVAAGAAATFAVSLAEDSDEPAQATAERIALGTAFTYQGRLDTGSGPASGLHDFQFRMFDDSAGTLSTPGTGIVSRTATVADGLFAVDIDFGTTPFDGDARFVEVRVKVSGAPGGFTLLDPLQPLTMAPQAIFAMKAGTSQSATSAGTAPWSGLTGVPSTFQDNLDDDTLGGLTCLDGEVAKFQSGAGTWACANDLDSDTLGGLICTNGKIAKFQAGAWACADDIVGTYSAGSGLVLSGTQFSVQFLGTSAINGTAPSAARSDHTHIGQSWVGAGGAGGLSVTNTNGSALTGTGTSFGVSGFSDSGHGLHAFSQSGTGIWVGGGTGWAAQFSGDVQIYGGGSCYCAVVPPSDVRLKRNIGTLDYGLAEVMALTPRSYRWKEAKADDRAHLGFVAQEVREIIPELVVDSKDGLLAVDYLGVIPVLTRAIQEQEAQIEALKSGASAQSLQGAGTNTPHAAIVQAPRGKSAGTWALPGAVALFALGLFAVAASLLRRAPRQRGSR